MKKTSNQRMIIVVVLVGLIAAAVGGAGAWWFTRSASLPTHKRGEDPNAVHKFVTLEKVTVMLRRGTQDTSSHFLVADLVFKTTEKKEKHAREQLPLLQSVAVRALSALTMEKAAGMTVDQIADEVGRAFTASYEGEQRDKPYSEVMVGRLIIE